MTFKEILEPIIKEIMKKGYQTGNITTNDLALLVMYKKECNQENMSLENMIKGGAKVISSIDKIIGV